MKNDFLTDEAIAKYIGFVIYPEHFENMDFAFNILAMSGMPCIISPLHHGSDGKKDHFHGILDNSESHFNGAFIKDILVKQLHTPEPVVIKNIFKAELYLTHSTSDSATKEQFTSDEKEVTHYVIH